MLFLMWYFMAAVSEHCIETCSTRYGYVVLVSRDHVCSMNVATCTLESSMMADCHITQVIVNVW